MPAFVSSTNFSNLPVMSLLEFLSGRAYGYIAGREDMLVSRLCVLDGSASICAAGIGR